jgi:hypothetical protein
VAGAGQRHAHHCLRLHQRQPRLRSLARKAPPPRPKRSALDFLPCNVQARQRTMAVGSPLVRRSDAPSTRVRAAGPKTAGGGRPREEPAALVGLLKQFVCWGVAPDVASPASQRLGESAAVAEHEPTAEFVYARSWKCVRSVLRHTSRVASLLRVDPLGCVPAPPHIPETCPSARSVRQHRTRYFL